MFKRVMSMTGAALLVTVVGLFMVVPAFAQGPTPTPERSHGWHGGGQGFGFRGAPWTGLDAAAEALGLTPEQLFSELRAGKSLAEVAEAQGVEAQRVYEAMDAARVEAMKAAIEQALADGRLSQAQGDWMLQGLEQGLIPMQRGHGHRPGFDHGGCQGHDTTPSSAPSVAPESSTL